MGELHKEEKKSSNEKLEVPWEQTYPFKNSKTVGQHLRVFLANSTTDDFCVFCSKIH